MALFHLSVTQTKRSAGQSAIASAAYRAGERLYSEYYGEYSDYTRKGGVICSDILLPPQAPPEYQDRQLFAHCDQSTVYFSVFGCCIQLDNLFAILTEKTNRSHNKTHDN